MKKILLTTLLPIFLFGCGCTSSISNTQSDTTQATNTEANHKEATMKDIIITENFAVVATTENDIYPIIKPNSEILGKLGEYLVVKGTKALGDIAYVKTADDHNYIIKQEITVKCEKGVSCIPKSMIPTHVMNDIYEVKVDDYDEWLHAVTLLENTDGVKKIAPTFFKGEKPVLLNK